jgi:hypothetical protein
MNRLRTVATTLAVGVAAALGGALPATSASAATSPVRTSSTGHAVQVSTTKPPAVTTHVARVTSPAHVLRVPGRPAAVVAATEAAARHEAEATTTTTTRPPAAKERVDAGGVTCTITWVGGVGSWSTTTDWSPARLPTSTDNVCITTAGSNVTLTGTTTSINTLTLGATTGAKSELVLQGLGCGSATSLTTVATTSADTVKKTGLLDLNSTTCSGNTSSFTTDSSLTNTGTLQTDPGTGGGRVVSGAVTNEGTVTINANTSYSPGTTFDNEGAVDLADGVALTVTSPASGGTAGIFVNDTGGSVVSSGTGATGQLVVDGGNTYTEGAGTTRGEPVLVNPNGGATATISYTGSGSSSVMAENTDTLTGTAMNATQSLTIEGVGCVSTASVTLQSNMTSAGQIYLNATSCSGSPDTLAVATGDTLTMSGSTAKLETDLGTGSARYLEGDITTKNGAATNINTNTDVNAAGTFDNGGPLTLADSAYLQLDSGTGSSFVDDTGGSVVSTGDSTSGDLVVSAGNSYTQGAGTTSGGPVYVVGSSLTYTGTGASTIDGESTGTLTGSLAAGQQLYLVSIGCGAAATETLTGSSTNAGLIDLTSTACSGGTTTLDVGYTGTKANELTNTGTIEVDGGSGGGRVIEGGIVNGATKAPGHIVINANTTYTPTVSIPGAKKPKVVATELDNKGVVQLANATMTVSATKKGTFKNDTGGSIVTSGGGQLVVDGPNLYSQGNGTTSGNPVVVSGGAVSFAAKGGAASVEAEGKVALTGTLNKGQTLTILGIGCGASATVTDKAALTDNGAIVLTATSCSGGATTLTLSGSGAAATLTVGATGSIAWPAGSGGSRTINANIVNDGVMGPSGTYALAVNGNYTQGSSGVYDVNVNTPNSADNLQVSGTASLAGTMTAVPVAGFTPTTGNTWTGVVTAGTVEGAFTTVNGPGGTWVATDTVTSVNLSFAG